MNSLAQAKKALVEIINSLKTENPKGFVEVLSLPQYAGDNCCGRIMAFPSDEISEETSRLLMEAYNAYFEAFKDADLEQFEKTHELLCNGLPRFKCDLVVWRPFVDVSRL